MMDTLSVEFSNTDLGIKISNDLTISALLWVNDVMTCTEGFANQKEELKRVNKFALKHKLKCNVMRVGVHDKHSPDKE